MKTNLSVNTIVNKSLKTAIIFAVLFIVYHSAEYMIVFKNNPVSFFLFQGLFFILAWVFGNWYSGNGLAAWGLPFTRKIVPFFAWGVILGILLYAIPFFINLLLEVEQIVKVPNAFSILNASLPFAFGVLFSSFSEDILTRGIIYAELYSKVKPQLLAVISALVYLLNHIYRLSDGPESWSYIFMLGIVFIIPVLVTKNLWLTGAMHWAGNVFFFVTHNAIQTEASPFNISPNYLFAISLFILSPFIYLVTKKIFISLTKSEYKRQK